MKVITVAGMIGVGKSSLTQLVGETYGGVTQFEKLDSPLLPLLYTATNEEKQARRIPFLLQLDFLNSRFGAIKNCLRDERSGFATLDRSIYEDRYFASVLNQRGEINDMELEIYDGILKNMLEELEELPQKAPHLTIYIQTSFDKAIERIAKRDRGFEGLDDETEDYFMQLWKGYDNFMLNEYNYSPVLVIDGDKLDFVENEEDRRTVQKMIDKALRKIGVIEDEPEQSFQQWAIGKNCFIKPKWFGEFSETVGVVQEVFTAHDGQYIVNVKVDGRENQITLYGEDQYEIIP
ncbi:deoxynucleoside kinase [Alkalicoccobacillus gibsonii]|uniref:deoxynucleoside kinase n=1 Tax=Alkalicoccobacillus gibsonii TaxID=79881 RepID=UPI0035132443